MGDNRKDENKETRKSISLETKMQVLRRLDGKKKTTFYMDWRRN